MHRFPHFQHAAICPLMAATLFLVVSSLCAQGAPAPIIFEDQTGWTNGVIDDHLTSDPKAQPTILITANHVLPKGLSVLQPKAGKMHQGLNFKGANAARLAEMQTLTLQGPLRVDFGREGSVTASFDDRIAFDFAGGPAVFETVTQDSHIGLEGPILNANGLIRRGKGARVYLNGQDLGGIVGPAQIEGGWLIIRDRAALQGITEVTLTGLWEQPAVLAMEGEDVSDRLPDAAPVTVSGGAAIALSGSNERAVSESLGKVTQRDNALQLEVRGKNAGAPVTLTMVELIRDPASLLIVGGEKFGEAAFVRVHQDAAIIKALKGGGGWVGSTTRSILPWARGIGGGGGPLSNSYGFLTYDHGTGFRELQREEYVEGLHAAAAQADNVRVTVPESPLTQSKTINALFCSLPKGLRHRVVDLGDKTLTITSGALSSDSQTAILGGALTTGNDQPLSFIGNFSLNNRLVGKGGAVFYSGAGDLTRLTNPGNSLTGDWTFVGGRVLVTDDEIIPDTVTLRFHPGGELFLEGSESVAAIGGNGVVTPAVGGRSAVMLGFCLAQANQVVMGPGGAMYPGDQTKEPAVGTLRLWAVDSDERIGFLKIEDGTLAIDVSDSGNDTVTLQSKNKTALVSGGVLRVNRLGGFAPEVGMSWEIIAGTAPATGRGFASVVDSAGKDYTYNVAPVGNSWVLTVTAVPEVR